MMRWDGTKATGVAVLAATVARQRWLRQALDAAGIAHWMVLLQDRQRGRMLPPFDGPLLLDTVGFERSVLAALLAELHDRRSPLPAFVRPVRDGDVLRILAELPYASTIQQAAAACVMSERTLKRKLRVVREALGIPATGLTRHRPSELAALLWTALDTFLVTTSVLCAQDAAETRGGIDCGYDDLIRSLPAPSRTLHYRAVSAHDPG